MNHDFTITCHVCGNEFEVRKEFGICPVCGNDAYSDHGNEFCNENYDL